MTVDEEQECYEPQNPKADFGASGLISIQKSRNIEKSVSLVKDLSQNESSPQSKKSRYSLYKKSNTQNDAFEISQMKRERRQRQEPQHGTIDISVAKEIDGEELQIQIERKKFEIRKSIEEEVCFPKYQSIQQREKIKRRLQGNKSFELKNSNKNRNDRKDSSSILLSKLGYSISYHQRQVPQDNTNKSSKQTLKLINSEDRQLGSDQVIPQTEDVASKNRREISKFNLLKTISSHEIDDYNVPMPKCDPSSSIKVGDGVRFQQRKLVKVGHDYSKGRFRVSDYINMRQKMKYPCDYYQNQYNQDKWALTPSDPSSLQSRLLDRRQSLAQNRSIEVKGDWTQVLDDRGTFFNQSMDQIRYINDSQLPLKTSMYSSINFDDNYNVQQYSDYQEFAKKSRMKYIKNPKRCNSPNSSIDKKPSVHLIKDESNIKLDMHEISLNSNISKIRNQYDSTFELRASSQIGGYGIQTVELLRNRMKHYSQKISNKRVRTIKTRY